MTWESVESLDDPRLDPYRDMRNRNLTRLSNRFIAESRLLVKRLLASDYEIESILIDQKYVDDAKAWIPPTSKVLLVEHGTINQLLGFHFHRGFLACGMRKPEFGLSVALDTAQHDRRWMAAYAIEVQDPENLGAILRSCACLGVCDVFLGPGTADPLSRRVLRVSMGTVLKLRMTRALDVLETLRLIHRQGVQSVATSLDESSIDLDSYRSNRPTVVLFGNEANGLNREVQDAVNDCIRIPMELGTDSLNVSVAAGIVLHHLRRIGK